jgi:hypothetical protein
MNKPGALGSAVEALTPYPVIHAVMAIFTAFVLLFYVTIVFKNRAIVPLVVLAFIRAYIRTGSIRGGFTIFTIIFTCSALLGTAVLIFDGTIPHFIAGDKIPTVLATLSDRLSGVRVVPENHQNPFNEDILDTVP